MKTICISAGVFAALLVALIVKPTPVLGAGDDDELKQLRERIETLEKTVLTDPFQPKHTVLARLTAAEDAITVLQKHDAAAEKVGAKDDDAIQKSITELRKTSEVIERRLKSVEDQLHRNGPADANDLRDLKRSMDTMTRNVNDLKNRVKRLEAKN